MTLTEYINAYFSTLIDELEITEAMIALVIDDILTAYGVDTESEATNLKKLYALARVEMWKRAMLEASFAFDISTDGNNYKHSQIYDFCQKNFYQAVYDASEYLPEFVIGIDQFSISGSRCDYAEYQ